MAAAPAFDGLAVGDIVAEHSFALTRDSLVRYAGASGDFNAIHYRDDVAREHLDALRGDPDHGAVETLVADEEVGAAAEHQPRLAVRPRLDREVDEVALRRGRHEVRGRSADLQRGELGERDVVRHVSRGRPAPAPCRAPSRRRPSP